MPRTSARRTHERSRSWRRSSARRAGASSRWPRIADGASPSAEATSASGRPRSPCACARMAGSRLSMGRQIRAAAPRRSFGEVRAEHQAGVHGDEGGDYNFYAYMAEVEVDPETGQITPVEIVMAVDVGTIINPTAHQGQLEGAFVYGLGNSLMEELVVEDGRV